VSLPERLTPLEEHSQKIRERSVRGEMPEISISVPFVPGSHFFIQSRSNRRLFCITLRLGYGSSQQDGKDRGNFHRRVLKFSECHSNISLDQGDIERRV
jgi:hypothetical protein